MEPLRIYVIWHPGFAGGRDLAEAIGDHFDKLGMARDGVKLGVPVRIRSTPLDEQAGPAPRAIDLDAADLNVLVLLGDRNMVEAASENPPPGSWRMYLDGLAGAVRKRGTRDSFLNLALTRRALQLPGLDDLQALRCFDWAKELDEAERQVRILLHLANAVGHHVKLVEKIEAGDTSPPDQIIIDKEQLFLSHAKKDGWGIVDRLRRHLNDAGFDIGSYVDAKDLPLGRAYVGQFEAQIKRSTFVAVRTDAYGTRPFCRWEMLRAKAHDRPIFIADRITSGEPRVFPYAGNAPSKPFPGDGPAEIERLLLDIMSEVLRRLLWQRRAREVKRRKEKQHGPFELLARPPELADLAFLAGKAAGVPKLTIVYPDPPIGAEEAELMDALRRNIDLRTLSEVELLP